MDIRVGFAEFDTLAPSIHVGWCEFDVLASGHDVRVGWCEFDTRAPAKKSLGPAFYAPGKMAWQPDDKPTEQAGQSITIEEDDEEVIVAVLMAIAARELA